MRSKAILVTLAIVLALFLSQACAEHYEKERYLEDTIESGGKLIKIMIDSNENNVAYFWDDEAHGWVEAGLSPIDLNRAYAEKITAQEMQGELDRMKDDTWDDRYRH